MSGRFGQAAGSLVRALGEKSGAVVSETMAECRVDRAVCDTSTLDSLRQVARLAETEKMGRVSLYGEIRDEIDLDTITAADLGDERVSLIVAKIVEDGFCYFLTQAGFAQALRDDATTERPRVFWIAADFAPFSSETITVSPWNGPRTHGGPTVAPESPRKFVKDLTFEATPAAIGPWLLRGHAPPPSSPIFRAWRMAAVPRLTNVLPSEIRRAADGTVSVVLKGPRSAPVVVADPASGWEEAVFPALSDAARWIYATPREAETKFQFLNNHMSLDWRQGSSWPGGLTDVLAGSLASAREAFAFHLQDQSKDALKSLGDLRKALQEEVAKAQSATRDLLGSLWRDFAIAGVVLALKSPTAPQITSTEVLRWVTLGAAVLLTISLCVTIGSNWRFNALADQGRREWRGKLYAFLSEPDWRRLVEEPIAKGRRVYRLVLPVVSVFYAVTIYYLLLVAAPEWTTAYIDPLVSSVVGAAKDTWSTVSGNRP